MLQSAFARYGTLENEDTGTTLDAEAMSTGGTNNCFEHPGTGLDDFLFDLKSDPNETTNLFDSKPDVVNKLMQQLEVHLRREVKPTWTPPVTSAYHAWANAGGHIIPWHELYN